MISNHASFFRAHIWFHLTIIFFCSVCCFHFSVCRAMPLSCLCLLHVIIKKHNANLLHVTSIYSSHSNWMIPPLLNCSVLTLCWNVHTSSRGIIKVSSLIGWIGRAWSCASSCVAVPAERQIFVLPTLSQAQSMQGHDSHRKLFPAPPPFCDLHQQGTPHPSLEFMMEHSAN